MAPDACSPWATLGPVGPGGGAGLLGWGPKHPDPNEMTLSSSCSPSTAPRGEGGPLRPCPGKEAAVRVWQLPRDPRSPVRPVLFRETQYVTFPARPRCKDPDRDDTPPPAPLCGEGRTVRACWVPLTGEQTCSSRTGVRAESLVLPPEPPSGYSRIVALRVGSLVALLLASGFNFDEV